MLPRVAPPRELSYPAGMRRGFIFLLVTAIQRPTAVRLLRWLPAASEGGRRNPHDPARRRTSALRRSRSSGLRHGSAIGVPWEGCRTDAQVATSSGHRLLERESRSHAGWRGRSSRRNDQERGASMSAPAPRPGARRGRSYIALAPLVGPCVPAMCSAPFSSRSAALSVHPSSAHRASWTWRVPPSIQHG